MGWLTGKGQAAREYCAWRPYHYKRSPFDSTPASRRMGCPGQAVARHRKPSDVPSMRRDLGMIACNALPGLEPIEASSYQ